jgi:death-on-curing protein
MAGLSLEDLTEVAVRSAGPGVRIRDLGLLSAALARVATRVHGRELYPSVEEQAAALLHSLATTVPLEEGNRAFAWAATAVYLARRGQPSMLDDASAVALVTDVSTGRLETVGAIAARLGGWSSGDPG